MRSTNECKTINKVYDILKTLSIKQLNEFRDQVFIGYGKNIKQSELLLGQVEFTIDKKNRGGW